MEAGRNFLSSSPPFPPRTHFRICPFFSVLMFHEQCAAAVTTVASASSSQHFPTSVLLQEPRDESKPLLQIRKEDGTSQGALDRRRIDTGSLESEEYDSTDFDQRLKDFQHQLRNWPGLWYLLPSSQTRQTASLTVQHDPGEIENVFNVEPYTAVALAKKALSASKQAVLLADDDSHLYGAGFDESLTPSSIFPSTDRISFGKEVAARSTRLLQRKNVKRRVAKSKIMGHESTSGREDLRRPMSEAIDPNDPLRLFLWGPETRKLLTQKEEVELIVHIQDLMRLDEVKTRLQSQFGREPTLIEWAEAMGIDCRVLQFQIHRGSSSREKLICANFRMVVHVAKQYQGRGLHLKDLLQEGSVGLMRSVEKFKPQAGCRFASYAYWWIRQAIRKAIFKHSRTIRLPDSVYSLLRKVTEAKKSCIQEGHHQPTKEQIAKHAGITVDRLDRLLFSARMPLSLQQPVWTDQDTTLQEVTADAAIETPDMSVSKQLMRKHVRSLLRVLNPRENKVIKLRFGIEDGKPRSLSEIGAVFGLSKERVRQLESRALHKLKEGLNSHGLDFYADLLH